MEEVDHLAHERSTAKFDVEAMKVVWAGSRQALEIHNRMALIVASDPEFRKNDRTMLGRKELFRSTLRKAAHAWKRTNELHLNEEEKLALRLYVDEISYADLHWGMFIHAIKGQGTDEQQRKWISLGSKMLIIGAYAQTELGHGSNVQGLETTATFDPKTDEFIIHSPTLTSSKWWPGGLGKVSTHAIVYARLITNGQDYGVHGFIVQLRSLDDHSPLPGITLGDIGAKFGNGGYNTMDNGVLRLDHVRIPRDQMLMRLSQVTREGEYIESDVPRQLIYGSMVYVRQTIVAGASTALSRAVCIAVRYSAVRRQFGSQESAPEIQALYKQLLNVILTGYTHVVNCICFISALVELFFYVAEGLFDVVRVSVIDYMTQQNRLFPLLASAYAFRFVGEWLTWLYIDVTKRLQDGDFETLAEVHASTAGLKSLTTSTTSDGIEECRKLCGGHGYLCSSGLPELFAAYVPACTYEGDNIVMLLQVARFLMKIVSQIGSGRMFTGTVGYFANAEYLQRCKCNVQKAEDWLNPSVILEVFEARAVRLAVNCAQNISRASNPEEGFSEMSADLVEVAVAHCELIIVSKFIAKVQDDIEGHEVKQQLQALCNIYALSLLHKHLGDFLSTYCITSKQGTLANELLRALYAQVRPNAVALVDAFNYTDHFLGSVLGRYDGNVYPHLYQEAWKDPLNDSDVPDGYHDYIRPLLKQQMSFSRL